MPMSCCMCELMETAPSFLARTHMRWSHSQSGRESTDHTLCVVHCVGRLRAWPTDALAAAEEHRRKVLDRCMALHMIYGRGPPKAQCFIRK